MADLGACGDDQLFVADRVSRLRLQLLGLGVHLCHRRAGLEVDACAKVAAQVSPGIAQLPLRTGHMLPRSAPRRACMCTSRSGRHTPQSAVSAGLTLFLVPLRRLLLAAAADAGVEARQTRSCMRASTAWLLRLCCRACKKFLPQLQMALACRRTIWQQVRLAEGWALV
jgi:hypothetical protein